MKRYFRKPSPGLWGKTLVLLAFSPWLWTEAAHGDVLKLSFFEALNLAGQRQIQAIVAEQRVIQAVEKIQQNRSFLFPQLQGTASQYRRTLNLETFGIQIPVPGFNPLVGPFNVFDARISLTQTLFDAAALSRLKSARMGQRLSEADREKARLDAMALVANFFIEAKRAEEKIPLLKTLLSRDQTRVNLAAERKNLGLGSDLELTQAKAVLAETRAQLVSAETQSVERRLDLAAALGLPQDQRMELRYEEKIDDLPLPEPSSFPVLIENHPEVKSARRLVAQREQDRKTEVAAYYPKLMGNADYGASGNHPGSVDDTYNFGGQLTVPIYQGGLRKGRVHEALSRIKESQAQLEDTRRQREAQAKMAQASLQRSFQAWQAAKADLKTAEQQLSLARTRLESGLGSPWELLVAKADRALALDQKEDAVATYYQARVNLAHSTGTLEKWTQNDE